MTGCLSRGLPDDLDCGYCVITVADILDDLDCGYYVITVADILKLQMSRSFLM